MRRLLRFALRSIGAILLFTALYFGAAEVGMRVPVNADADPMAGTVSVYFVSNGPHVDIVLPLNHPSKSWGQWLVTAGFGTAGESGWNYAHFGWGDRDFFTKVPAWEDLRPGIALRGVFLPTPTAMRVSLDGFPPKSSERCHLMRLTEPAYADLCQYIEGSFEAGEGGLPRELEEQAVNQAESIRFFRANGSYHMFHTCNVWTNDALKAAGQRAALWAPMSRGVLRQLPRNQGRAD